MKKIFYFIIMFQLLSCDEKPVKIDLPPILENNIPSQDNELPFDLNTTEYDFPDKIKKIYQLQNRDTLNILEFDKQKNLIFKFYKQYGGKYWHDKFIFMIEANVFSKNKLIRTYYLHSNVGYELFTYDYNNENIVEVKSYILDNIKGVNINQYSFIKKIKDYKTCMAFVKKLDIENKNKVNYTIKREFGNNQVKEYFNNQNTQSDDSYKLYILNDKNKIEKIEYYAKNKKWEINTKYFKYDNLNNLLKAYSINEKFDTLKSTEYGFNNSNRFIIKKENGFEISRKEFLRNNLIKHQYQGIDSSYYGKDEYILDKFGIPIKMIEVSKERDTSYTFKNYYEFYN